MDKERREEGEKGKGGEKHLADVKEDHMAQDNITRDLSHPLPLIYSKPNSLF